MGEFVRVAGAGEIAPGEARVVEAGERRIALFNVDGRFMRLTTPVPTGAGLFPRDWLRAKK